MTDKPKLTKKDIEEQNTMMDYQEINKRIEEDDRLINVLYKCLETTTTEYEIDELLDKNMGFILSLPDSSFLDKVKKHRDKLNETEDK